MEESKATEPDFSKVSSDIQWQDKRPWISTENQEILFKYKNLFNQNGSQTLEQVSSGGCEVSILVWLDTSFSNPL